MSKPLGARAVARLEAAGNMMQAPSSQGGPGILIKEIPGVSYANAVLRLIEAMTPDDKALWKERIDWVEGYGFEDEPPRPSSVQHRPVVEVVDRRAMPRTASTAASKPEPRPAPRHLPVALTGPIPAPQAISQVAQVMDFDPTMPDEDGFSDEDAEMQAMDSVFDAGDFPRSRGG